MMTFETFFAAAALQTLGDDHLHLLGDLIVSHQRQVGEGLELRVVDGVSKNL